MAILTFLGLFIMFHPKLQRHPYRLFSFEILTMTLGYEILFQRLYLAASWQMNLLKKITKPLLAIMPGIRNNWLEDPGNMLWVQQTLYEVQWRIS